MSGVFHAAILFLVAAGLQVVFGVQKIFNLACGSFYALGAYTGVSAVGDVHRSGRTAGTVHRAARGGGPRGGLGGLDRRARALALRLRPGRDVSAPADLRPRAHDGGPDPHDVGDGAAVDRRPLPGVRPGDAARRDGARLQPHRHRGEPRHRARHRLAADAHRLRPHHPRERRQPRDGRGARREHAARVRAGVHPRAPRSAPSAARS